MTKVLLLFTVMLLTIIPIGISQENGKPLLLIYSPGAPAYGRELQRILEKDGRIEADFQVLETPEIFRVKLYFPNVKAAIITLADDRNEGLGPTLEWFFSQGGGLVGLGFSGARLATANASEKVFPIFGSTYVSGTYDPAKKRFAMTFAKGEEDEISLGIGDFTTSNQKLVLSYNGSSNTYLPRFPAEGEYKVLFRETKTGAPSIVKYDNVGVSVTFACFGGDDFERGFNYFGLFTETDEFKTLFTNSVAWVWNNELKYERSMARATEFFQEREAALQDVLERAEELERRTTNAALIRTLLTIMLASVGVGAVYWFTFLKPTRAQEGS